jgi:hypothetical protein
MMAQVRQEEGAGGRVLHYLTLNQINMIRGLVDRGQQQAGDHRLEESELCPHTLPDLTRPSRYPSHARRCLSLLRPTPPRC